MKCLVAVKRVIDPYVAIRVRADNTGVETANVKMAINPLDEIAIEEAVQQKEKGIISEIIAVSFGSNANEETLRQALARGADRAVLLETDQVLQPLAIAKILHKVVEQNNVQVVILGKQAIDDDCNQTGQMLAACLGWAQGTFISKAQFAKDQGMVTVVREVDEGLETLKLKLPVVLTTDLRLNEPRYISLPNVMQAKRKPLSVIKLTDYLTEFNIKLPLGVDVIKVEPPATRSTGIMVTSVTELIAKLQTETKVI